MVQGQDVGVGQAGEGRATLASSSSLTPHTFSHGLSDLLPRIHHHFPHHHDRSLSESLGADLLRPRPLAPLLLNRSGSADRPKTSYYALDAVEQPKIRYNPYPTRRRRPPSGAPSPTRPRRAAPACTASPTPPRPRCASATAARARGRARSGHLCSRRAC